MSSTADTAGRGTQPSKKSCCAPSGPKPQALNIPTTPERGARSTTGARRPPHAEYAEHADRITLPGETFRMGSEDADANPGDGEGPVRDVSVSPFAIDAYAVTNARFAAFVEQTGYLTEAGVRLELRVREIPAGPPV
jgi:formylglycine-generating enzyme